jgi:PAS domain S-box-containing protein
VAHSILTDPNFAPWRAEALKRGYASSLVLPLKVGDRVLGALNIYSVKPDSFDAEETKLLAELADDLTYGITALRISTQQKQDETALRESEERLRLLGDNLPDSYVFQFTQEKDGTPRFLYLSAGVERLHSVKVEDVLRDASLLRRQIAGDLVPAIQAAETASLQYMMDFTMELRMCSANEQWRWMQVCSRPRRSSNGQVVWDGVATDITARKQAEAANQAAEQRLAESERQYRELVMLANSIILRWSPEGRITFLNEFGQRFFGYTATEIIGRHVVGTLVPEGETEGLDLRPLMEEICADPRKFERNINENIRRNGERVWVDWTNKAVFDEQGKIQEILSIGSDITDRRQAEEQIRRLNDDLRRHADTLEQRVAERTAELAAINDEQRTIFESASAGIVLLRDRVIVRCNRKLEEISGYTSGELVGKSTRIWYPDEESYVTIGKNVYVQMARGETYRQEQQMARKDGSLFWVRMSLHAFDKNAPLKGAVGIIEDITDEREAAERLREAMEAAQAADRIKSAFLATMSHELRTPLNSIIGFTGIMIQGLTGPLNTEQQKQMTMVQNSARHLLSLINDVLDISKIEAGQLELSLAPFDLKSSIEKMIKLISPLAVQKGIDLQLKVAENIGCLVTDQRRFEQIILNLLSNAVKFTEKGHVGISCRSENDHILLSFSDTGIGMQQEELPNLFQPFRQIDTGLARKHEGTGLGLSICKKILDIMGGSIEVESQWGQGSTFRVRIPRQAGSAV